MTKRLFLSVALTASILLPTTAAFANDPEHFHKKHDEIQKQFLDEINATPDQRQQIEATNKNFESQVDPIRTELQQKRKALMEYLATPDATKEEALKQQAAIDDLKARQSQLMIDHTFNKKALLNPDQQQKAKAFFEKKNEEWQKKHNELDD